MTSLAYFCYLLIKDEWIEEEQSHRPNDYYEDDIDMYLFVLGIINLSAKLSISIIIVFYRNLLIRIDKRIINEKLVGNNTNSLHICFTMDLSSSKCYSCMRRTLTNSGDEEMFNDHFKLDKNMNKDAKPNNVIFN